MKAESEHQFDFDDLSRPLYLEVVFCLAFGVFLEAKGWPAAVALVCFGLFFFLWLCWWIDRDLERGEQ